jgi:hypothetical protein
VTSIGLKTGPLPEWSAAFFIGLKTGDVLDIAIYSSADRAALHLLMTRAGASNQTKTHGLLVNDPDGRKS